MLKLSIFTIILSVYSSVAFVPSSRTHGCGVSLKRVFAPVSTKLLAYADRSHNFYEKNEPAKGGILYFLTQRALQSFMLYSQQSRDPHTVRWMEEYGDMVDMLQFHGTGAFNMTRWEKWDSFLLDLAQEPPAEIIIRAKRRGRGQGGWSKKNPYLEERFVEYKVDVDPPSLVTRILSIREQLAIELANDLELVSKAGELIIESYHENMRKRRDDEESDRKTEEECVMPDPNDLAFPYSTSPDECETTSGDMAFTARQGFVLLENDCVFAQSKPSPLRQGNFDLVNLLTLQEAIHRVLRDLRNDGSSGVATFDFLLEFYKDRLKSCFDGDGRWYRDEVFLNDLMSSSPKVIASGLIDPVGIAEKIIRARGDVALEWSDLAANVPQDHMELRRVILNQRMDASTAIPQSPSSGGIDVDYGEAFQ